MTPATSTLKTISLQNLTVDPAQPRKLFDEDELHRLAESLKSKGQLVPLIVVAEKDSNVLIDGERRYRAAPLAGIRELLCMVLTVRPSADELLALQLTVNTQRRDLNPIEKLQAFQKLMQLKGWNSAELAQELSISKSTVTRILALGKLTAGEQAMVAEGLIGSADAYAMSRLPDEARKTAQQMAEEGTLGREALERLAIPEAENQVRRRSVRLELGSFVGSFQTEGSFTLTELIEWLGLAMRECKQAARKGLDVTTLSRVLADRSRFERKEEAAC